MSEVRNMGKNIDVGIGLSSQADAYKAGAEAASKSLASLKGKTPILSYVFFAGDYDPNTLSAGLKAILNKSEFVGGSADAVYCDETMLRKGVLVVSIHSDYLHVGVASMDNISKDPYTAARKTITDALNKLSIDKYVDPYLLFTRMKKANVKWLVKLPSFFVTVFTRGMKLPQMADETKILRGITDEIGFNVPIWGGSFGTALEKLFEGKPYEIYLLHSGKVLKDGMILIFNTCSLVYGQSLSHGAKRTEHFGYISGVAGNGYVITSISQKNPIDWYCDNLKLSKEEFKKNPMVITQKYPLGIPDSYGGFTIRAGGVPTPDETSLAFTAPFIEGWPIYLMDSSPSNFSKAPEQVAKDIRNTNMQQKPSVVLGALCASRRVVLGDSGMLDELKQLKKEFKGTPVTGFSCFTEIGARVGAPPSVQHEAVNILTLYDMLLHEIKE